MKYVIDTSVEIKKYVQEQDSAKAVRLRNEYHQGVHRLTAPDIFPTEMCNVLMILERSGQIARVSPDAARLGIAPARLPSADVSRREAKRPKP